MTKYSPRLCRSVSTLKLHTRSRSPFWETQPPLHWFWGGSWAGRYILYIYLRSPITLGLGRLGSWSGYIIYLPEIHHYVGFEEARELVGIYSILPEIHHYVGFGEARELVGKYLIFTRYPPLRWVWGGSGAGRDIFNIYLRSTITLGLGRLWSWSGYIQLSTSIQNLNNIV